MGRRLAWIRKARVVPRLRRWLVWALAGAMVLLVVAVVVINWRGAAARDAAFQAMADAGIALPERASSEADTTTYNGASLVRAAMEASAFPHDWGEDAPAFSTDESMYLDFGEPIDPRIAERMIRFRDRLAVVLDLAKRAAEAERYDYDPWAYLHQEQLGDFAEMRRVARILQAAALADEAEGDFDAALQRYRQLAIINTSTTELPTATWHLVRGSIDALIHGALEETLSRGVASPAAVAALREALVTAEAKFSLADLVSASVIEQAVMLEDVRTAAARQHLSITRWVADVDELDFTGLPIQWERPGTLDLIWTQNKDRLQLIAAWLCPGWFEMQWAGAIDETLAWLDVVALPADERARQLTLAAQSDDHLASMLRTVLINQAWLRVAAAALAVEGYRLEHGDWPASPADLADAWMTDPFDGQPLRFRHTDEGVVVYSIGRDLEDDGGLDDHREGDIDFRLLSPAGRAGTAPQ